MANGYGQKTFGATGGGAVLSADGRPTYVAGGVTIDWATIPAFGADTTLADGTIIPAGTKFLPFGCILTKITASSQYGPHQPGVADGRQTIAKGGAFLLNQTIIETDAESQYGPGAIDGGRIFSTRLKRLNAGGTAFEAHPVDGTFNGAFPQISFAEH